MSCRHLILILGDQLDRDSPALQACDKNKDRVLMIESREESTRVWSHKARTALFLAAMRHHRDWLKRAGYRVDYVEIGQPEAESFASALSAALHRHEPQRLLMTGAGEFGVQQTVDSACAAADTDCEVVTDSHFLCTREQFDDWRGGRKTLVMEHFYRHMRQRDDILMVDGEPAGGQWNYDKDNRKPAGADLEFPGPLRFEPDEITAEVTRLAGTDGILGNEHASGTEIIARLGETHQATGWPICYTSADSVFQIAAHEQVVPLEELYRCCLSASQ